MLPCVRFLFESGCGQLGAIVGDYELLFQFFRLWVSLTLLLCHKFRIIAAVEVDHAVEFVPLTTAQSRPWAGSISSLPSQVHSTAGSPSRVVNNAKIKLHRTAIRSPNTVAFVERFVQSIQQECLDHFIVFGHKHMDVLCSEFKEHYHLERPYQGLDNEQIVKPSKRKKPASIPSSIRLADVQCKERLGGLLSRYSLKSAA
jgi:transposase InsO family protein